MRERGDPLRFNDQFLEFVQSVFLFLFSFLHDIVFGGADTRSSVLEALLIERIFAVFPITVSNQ